MVRLRSQQNEVTSGTKSNQEYKKDNNQSREPKDGSINVKKIQFITFTSLVIDLLGFTVILPLFPSLLEYYSKHDSSGFYNILQRTVESVQIFLNVPKEFNSVLFGGIIGSLFSLLQFLSSPICGALSDVFGRKPVVLCCLIGIAMSYGLWFVANNFIIFVFARIIGGLSKGNVSLSYSIMADILDSSSRSTGMALIGVAFSIGFIIGPVVGVAFSKWGTSGWFAASALYAFTLAMINIVFFSLTFQETLPESKRLKTLTTGFKEASKFINPMKIFRFDAVSNLSEKDRRRLIHLGRIYFLYMFVYSGLEFTITFVTHHKHSFDSMAQGKMFTYLGFVMAVVQGGFVRRMKAGMERKMCLMGLSLMIPAFILIGLSETIFVLYIGLTMYSIASSLMVPCLTSLASNFAPISQKGTVMGIWRSLGALARAVGPLLACIGFWTLGCIWTYVAGGFLLMIPFMMLKGL